MGENELFLIACNLIFNLLHTLEERYQVNREKERVKSRWIKPLSVVPSAIKKIWNMP